MEISSYYSKGLSDLCTEEIPEQFLRKILVFGDNFPQNDANLSIFISIPVANFIEFTDFTYEENEA